MGKNLSILITACDPFLAGIYARKFERDGWEVEVAEDLKEAERKSAKMKPAIILLDDGCTADMASEIRRFKSFPTIQRSKLVVLADFGDREKISAALQAGATDYLIYGHFVPQEAVQKMRKLLDRDIMQKQYE